MAQVSANEAHILYAKASLSIFFRHVYISIYIYIYIYTDVSCVDVCTDAMDAILSVFSSVSLSFVLCPLSMRKRTAQLIYPLSLSARVLDLQEGVAEANGSEDRWCLKVHSCCACFYTFFG